MWAMGWMMLGMFLFWGVLIFLAVLLVKALFQSGTSQPRHDPVGQSPGEILAIRYSRGEITREQYEQMKKDLNV